MVSNIQLSWAIVQPWIGIILENMKMNKSPLISVAAVSADGYLLSERHFFSIQQIHAPQLLRLIFINSLFFFILAIFIFYIYLYPVCCNSSKTAATQHKSKRITFSYFLKLKRLGLHLRWKGIDSIQYMQRERAVGRGMKAKWERSGNCGCETWMRTKEKWFFL